MPNLGLSKVKMRFFLILTFFLFLITETLSQSQNKDSIKILYDRIIKEPNREPTDSTECELLSLLMDLSTENERIQYA